MSIVITRSELHRAAAAEGPVCGKSLIAALEKLLPEAAPAAEQLSFPDFESEAGGDLSDMIQHILNYDGSERPDALTAIVRDEDVTVPEGHQARYHLNAEEKALADADYIGEVGGVGCEESGFYYLLDRMEGSHLPQELLTCAIGLIVPAALYDRLLNADVSLEGYTYFGARQNSFWSFCRCNEQKAVMDLGFFSVMGSLFSRNTGLFESSTMQEKYAVIVGSGSVGSRVAMELACAGVGRFYLIDNDVFKLCNICRHTLDFRSLGQYKTEAMKQAILYKNPSAQVHVFNGTIQQLPLDFLPQDQNGVIVATADCREANAAANDLAAHMDIPFSAIGCWTRAHAGEVFYWNPGQNTPTYREAFGDLVEEAERNPGHANYFADEFEAASLNYEPGTSVDLGFVTLIGCKVCLDQLNLNDDSYTCRVLDYLTPYTLICNTNNTKIGGKNAAVFPHPLFISHTIHPEKGDVCGA